MEWDLGPFHPNSNLDFEQWFKPAKKADPYALNWPQLNGILKGISTVDLNALHIRTREQALQFAAEYGINPMVPDQLTSAWRAHSESLQFLKTMILTPEEWEVFPESVKNPEHLLDLVVMASNYLNQSRVHQMFSCAVLKVMHCLFHIDFDLKLRFFDQIRAQVFTGFEKLTVTRGKRVYLEDRHQSIPMLRYVKKKNKDRSSLVLKLLNKSQTVASDIYDHLGMRLVFNTKFECLFALKMLHRNHIVTHTNLKPFRSRNSLIDFQAAQKIFKKHRSQLQESKRYPTLLLKKMDRELNESSNQGDGWDNPFSSSSYKSMQVTVRRMIRVNNPFFRNWSEWVHDLNDLQGPEADSFRAKWLDKGPVEEIPFYFDYEIQLLDKESYRSSLIGPASHKAYKERQRLATRARILGPELDEFLKNLPQAIKTTHPT